MIQILRGLSSEFTNRILQDGQIGYCTDTGLVYIGDGHSNIQKLTAVNDNSSILQQLSTLQQDMQDLSLSFNTLQQDIISITQTYGQPNGLATLDMYGKLIQPLGSGEDLSPRLVFAQNVTPHQWMTQRIGSACFVYFYFDIVDFPTGTYSNVCSGLPPTSTGGNYYVYDERRSCSGIQLGADGTLNVHPNQSTLANIYGLIMYPCVTDD